MSFGWFSWEFLSFRCVLVGFLLVIMVKKCKLWVLENIRKVYGDFWGGSMAFGFFFRFGGDPVLGSCVFDMFCGVRCVLLSSYWS